MITRTIHTRSGRYLLWFDRSIKSWTLLTLDRDGNQVGNAEYFANRTSLLMNYPEFRSEL